MYTIYKVQNLLIKVKFWHSMERTKTSNYGLGNSQLEHPSSE